MDPISIIIAVNLFISMSANMSGAKRGMKAKLANVSERPKSYLQKIPPNIAATVLVLAIAAIFNLGVFSDEIKEKYFDIRMIGLVVFIIFSWVQVYSYKALGRFYSQDILIFKNHELKQSGFYKFIRHPQYVSQFLSDLGVGIALMGYLIVPIVILIEIPLFVLRAKLEDGMLKDYFVDEFKVYKRKTGFIFPFFG